jgi:hypothetical protein
MNVEIGTEAPIFLFWEYLFHIFDILSLQCSVGDLFRELPAGACQQFAWSDLTEISVRMAGTFFYFKQF